MPPQRTTDQRVTKLESRLTEVESGFGDTQYKMNRRLIKVELSCDMLLEHFHIGAIPDDAIDEILDRE